MNHYSMLWNIWEINYDKKNCMANYKYIQPVLRGIQRNHTLPA